MKTNIEIAFKSGEKCLFDANSFGFEDDGFCYLDFVNEKDEGKLAACVLTSEIKYLKFVEVDE